MQKIIKYYINDREVPEDVFNIIIKTKVPKAALGTVYNTLEKKRVFVYGDKTFRIMFPFSRHACFNKQVK